MWQGVALPGRVMRQNLRVSLGAVVLALATLAAVIFALINFDQRTRFEVVYDGVAWLDTDHGIQASRVSPNSPATRAGIHPGDTLLRINSASVTRAADVARREAPRNRELPPNRRPALSVHRPVHLHPPLERSSRCALLRLLPGFLHSLVISFQRKVGH